VEDYFSWFDPASWLADIGNFISEGLGVLAQPINALADGFNNFITGIGDFFSNLIDSLGSWFDDVGQWFASLGESIGQWFTDLRNGIGQWFSDLGNSIGQWFTDLGNSIGQWFTDLFSTLGEILNYLNPFHENFFLKIALIPSDGFITGKFDELKGVLDDRLPIIGTFTGIFDSITQVQSIDNTTPTFTMELPGKWGGQTVQVINFTPIDPYVPYIKTLIRFFLWIPFIIKMYKRLPQVIY
jgi:phage-related protein